MQIMGFLVELFALFCVSTLLLGFASHAVGHGVYGKVSHSILLSLWTSAVGTVPSGIPMELCRLSKSSGHRKRGRRGGLHQRLKTLRLDNCRKLPPLPSVLLSNVQSIRNKLDELETYAKFKREVKDTCLLAFTETWLGDANPDLDLNLTGFGSPIRMDRSSEITGKNQGGGVCFYVNEWYCNTVVIREKICTTDVELLTISLRPFYLPHEFQQLFYTVYIHPRPNATVASQLIADVTHKLDSICPESPKFILGDFNHCNL